MFIKSCLTFATLSNGQADETSTNVTFTFDISNITPQLSLRKYTSVLWRLNWSDARPPCSQSEAWDVVYTNTGGEMWRHSVPQHGDQTSEGWVSCEGHLCPCVLFSPSRLAPFKRGRACPLKTWKPRLTDLMRIYMWIRRLFCHVSTISEPCVRWRERRHRCRAGLCAHLENRSIWGTRKRRRDECWLSTCLRTSTLLGLYTRGAITKTTLVFNAQFFYKSLSTKSSSVRSPSRPPPGGWGLTPDWPFLRESPAAGSSHSWWWATRAAAAPAAPPRAAVWSERAKEATLGGKKMYYFCVLLQ